MGLLQFNSQAELRKYKDLNALKEFVTKSILFPFVYSGSDVLPIN
jgi:hypothetical protein